MPFKQAIVIKLLVRSAPSGNQGGFHTPATHALQRWKAICDSLEEHFLEQVDVYNGPSSTTVERIERADPMFSTLTPPVSNWSILTLPMFPRSDDNCQTSTLLEGLSCYWEERKSSRIAG